MTENERALAIKQQLESRRSWKLDPRVFDAGGPVTKRMMFMEALRRLEERKR